MKKELFKEMNAHIRACDNKSLALNAAYLGGILFVNTRRAEDRIFTEALARLGVEAGNSGIVLGIVLLIVGYIVLFTHLWYRAWKVIYLNICHEIWVTDKEAFGDAVPMWMKAESKIMGWDNLFRLVPFLVNVAVLINIAAALQPQGFIFWLLSAAFLALHMLISLVILRYVSKNTAFAA